MGKLPAFDTMIRLHREDPEAPEILRQGLPSELDTNASNDAKRRIQALQFRIDMEFRRAGNPNAWFLKMSGMMKEAISELSNWLSSRNEAFAEKHRSHKADILQLFEKPSLSSHPSKH